jgi:hypothetical protein
METYRKLRFCLSISSEAYLAYYQGAVNWVQARCRDGTRVRFPASILRPFVSSDGIEGDFEMMVDEANRLVSFHRLEN